MIELTKRTRCSEVKTPYIAAVATVILAVPLLFIFDVDSIILLPIYAGSASLFSLSRRRPFATRGRELLKESRKAQAILVFQTLVLGAVLVALREHLQPIVIGAVIVSWIAVAFYQASYFAAVEGETK